MSTKSIYAGDANNTANKVIKLLHGDASNTAKKVKKMFFGDTNGLAKMVYNTGSVKPTITYYGVLTSLSSATYESCYGTIEDYALIIGGQ